MASSKIILKNSSIPNSIPSTSSLVLGELAINTFDGKLFLERSNSIVNDVIPIVSLNINNIGSLFLTGSFNMTGSSEINGDLIITSLRRKNLKTVDFDYNVIESDDIIFVNSENNVDVFLFPAADNFGKELTFRSLNKKITLIPDVGETINNDSDFDIKSEHSVRIIASGSGWWTLCGI